MNLTIVVFARAPRAGETKTRLIPALGAAGAAALHRAFIADTLATARGVIDALGPGRLVLAHASDGGPPDSPDPILAALAEGADATLRPQRGAGLGARMRDAITDALHDSDAALLLGSDAPTLPAALLRAALDGLAGAEGAYALGPAVDGGYVLVGARTSAPRFDGVRMGTSHARADTIRANGERPLVRVAPWYDVDRPEDLRLLALSLRSDPAAAPATREIATNLGVLAWTW